MDPGRDPTAGFFSGLIVIGTVNIIGVLYAYKQSSLSTLLSSYLYNYTNFVTCSIERVTMFILQHFKEDNRSRACFSHIPEALYQ